MGFQLGFELEGERQVSAELGIAADHIKDWRQPLTSVGSELLKAFDLNFASRGQLFGGWAPRTKDYPWPLLEKTGQMRKSFHSQVAGDAVVLGNPTPYFKYHQSNQPRRRLPRRVMMKIDEARRNLIFKIFQAHVIDATRGLR
jgi:phage gpG-like protein